MLDKAKLGTRYNCFKCEAKFYDLNRPEPVCPKCGGDQREAPSSDPRVAVMARYKGSRMTSEQAKPFREAFTVEETEEVEGEGAKAGATADESEGTEADASSPSLDEDDAADPGSEDGADAEGEEEPASED
jgi:uncharacterized protein (TIGR02300 family)